jgi:hypothetical protein
LQRDVRAKLLVGVVSLLTLAPACATTSQHPRRPAGPTLRIEKLRGTVVRLGTMNGYRLLGVRLRATVCVGFGSPQGVYPDAIGVAHYVVTRSRKRWWPARSVIDHAPWLVPLGETWHGRSCGHVVVEDPITPDHYGVESLGNPLSCYGVRFSIEADGQRASRRTIVRCGGLRVR